MKNTTPTIYLSVLFILMAGVMYVFYILQGSLIKVNAMQSEVDQIATGRSRLENLNLMMPPLKEKINVWEKTLPSSEEDVAAFAALLEQVAKTQNLSITIHFQDFPLSSKISGVEMVTLGTDITLEGSFTGLTNFVSQLSSSGYFYKIDKMTITKQETLPGVKALLNGSLVTNFEVPAK